MGVTASKRFISTKMHLDGRTTNDLEWHRYDMKKRIYQHCKCFDNDVHDILQLHKQKLTKNAKLVKVESDSFVLTIARKEIAIQRDDIIGHGDVLIQGDCKILHCMNDSRLSKLLVETEDAGNDDVLIHCDGYIVHCMNDRRLSKPDNGVIRDEDQDIVKTINERGELAETIEKMVNGKTAENPVKLFNRCVGNGHSLCCRFLLKCKQPMHTNLGLVKACKKSICLSNNTFGDTEKAKHVDTAKAITWQITRMFYKNQKDQRIFKNIYPAFKCICENKWSSKFFCSDELYIVVEVAKFDHSLPKIYDGIQIYQQFNYGLEGKLVNNQQHTSLHDQHCSATLQHGVESKFAHQCFVNHSNLISIVPSFVRSRHFNTKMHQLTIAKCATFTCRLKGFIPIGERHFPDAVQASDGTKVQTDVVEGNVNLANLMVGDHIESTTMCGTLGGVLLYYNKKCFITCGHVMMDERSMISRKSNSIHTKDLRVFVKDENGQRIECGNAMRCEFETGSDTKPGIDVAIIEMNPQCKVNPNSMVQDRAKNTHSHIFLGMSNEYLNENCIDYELLTLTNSEVETMAFGQLTKVEHCKTVFGPERMIEVELKNLGQAIAVANGNPTFPVMIAQPAHFQMYQGSPPATTTFRMYNQLCLNVSLVSGDSGTCIYIRNCPYSKANEKWQMSSFWLSWNGHCIHKWNVNCYTTEKNI